MAPLRFAFLAPNITVIAAAFVTGLTHPAKLNAQTALQTAAPLQFNAASLKLSVDQGVLMTRPIRSVGRLRWTTQLAYVVSYAYNMAQWRISGDDAAFGSIFEIEATTDPQTTDDQVRLMLQSLLMDRFKMTVHRVTKDADGYVLTLTKNGPKMQEAKDEQIPALPEWMRQPSSDPSRMEGLVVATVAERAVGALTGRRATMLQLAGTLERILQAAVPDQTGLAGKYYFAVRYAQDNDPDVPYPNLFGAIKKLGLQLEKRKVPTETLVVDHMEKIPTEN